MIAVCIPSRGLIHSRTIESLNHIPVEYYLFVTNDLPIPECFNHLTELALGNFEVDVVWFIEEDIAIKPDTYEKMRECLDDGFDVVAYNYAITPTHDVIQDKDGRYTFGTGCTMIKRKVLENYTWKAEYHYHAKTFERIPIPEKARSRMYGMHDIEFAYHCFENNIPVKLIMDRVSHWKIHEYGEQGKNKGYHIVREAGNENPHNQ